MNLTFLPDLHKHGHHHVVGQCELLSIGKYGVPQDEQIGKRELTTEEQAEPSTRTHTYYIIIIANSIQNCTYIPNNVSGMSSCRRCACSCGSTCAKILSRM